MYRWAKHDNIRYLFIWFRSNVIRKCLLFIYLIKFWRVVLSLLTFLFLFDLASVYFFIAKARHEQRLIECYQYTFIRFGVEQEPKIPNFISVLWKFILFTRQHQHIYYWQFQEWSHTNYSNREVDKGIIFEYAYFIQVCG